MVDIHGRAFANFGVVHTRRVVSEIIDNLEADGDWAHFIDGMGEFELVTFSNVEGAIRNRKNDFFLVEVACAVFGGVMISRIGLNASNLLEVFEGMGW